jgi:uncharacterized coiled-coil DUF342 family protein
MSRTSQLFEILAEASKENKKVEQLQEQFNGLNKNFNSLNTVLNDINNKVSLINDVLKSKVSNEDFQSFNLRYTEKIEDLKKSLNVNEEMEKKVEEFKKSFVDLNEYNKDIENITIALQKYIKNPQQLQTPNEQTQYNELNERLKKLELSVQSTPRNIPVRGGTVQVRQAKTT